MAISTEGKIGIGLALLFGAGSGAMMVAPNHLEIGWSLIAFSLAGLIALGWHHFLGVREKKMVAFYGMIICGVGLLFFSILYFWPPRQLSNSIISEQLHEELDDPPIGGIKYVNTTLEIAHSHSKNIYAGRVKVEFFNDTAKLIFFHATTAGRINEIPFGQNKIEFDGYAYPKSAFHLFSTRLSDIPIEKQKGAIEPSVHCIYEYDINYRFAEQKKFSRRTAKGLRIEYYAPIAEKPVGTVDIGRTDITFYDEREE